MNAKEAIDEMDLAAFKLAEAESLEKRAAKLRSEAIRHNAKVSLELRSWFHKLKAADKAAENQPPPPTTRN